MSKASDEKLKERIERILNNHPGASSREVRRRLMTSVNPRHFYPHLIPFYEQGKINDSAEIDFVLNKMMDMHLGMRVITQVISSSYYNYLQVEKALLLLSNNFHHIEQAKRCKEARFGTGSPKDADHQSTMVMYLQKQGHRLFDIWKVLGIERDINSRKKTKATKKPKLNVDVT
ncbi:hypothetical protein ACPV47_02205 [Vibrio jasicida]|uniref:hypothetical protein n=1 Tax=Vibrio jasicida TaxID=766224 RepID=UPI004068C7C1